MHSRLGAMVLLAVSTACGGSGDTGLKPYCDLDGHPPWLAGARVVAAGQGVTNGNCRDGALCRHNENVDLVRWKGAVWLVHRTANSQILGPNSALHIYRSPDDGASFERRAVIPALEGRDLRDPHFYLVGDELFIKAITRVPGFTARDTDVKSVSVAFRSTDGVSWTTVGPLAAERWSFWRVVVKDGIYYSAAYEDGDLRVVLYHSHDGVAWTAGPTVYDVAADTPLETELVFVPSGKLLALVRMDGIDEELLGDRGRLRTKICWATPPYESFSCPGELTGVRLDGPVAFTAGARLLVIARKHLPVGGRKRTALYELTGDLDGGVPQIQEWGELPSASDTSYAGVVSLGAGRFVTAWYSGAVELDESWSAGFLGATDIWRANLELAALPARPTPELCPQLDARPPTVVDAGADAADGCGGGDPESFCGRPCDVGNDKGVGQYCTSAADCTANSFATVCSNILNPDTTLKSYICTNVCVPPQGSEVCGEGARCDCIPLNSGPICGCIPDRCVLADAGP